MDKAFIPLPLKSLRAAQNVSFGDFSPELGSTFVISGRNKGSIKIARKTVKKK
jgi:hypothetical protein